jgi:hypothetical protein
MQVPTLRSAARRFVGMTKFDGANSFGALHFCCYT